MRSRALFAYLFKAGIGADRDKRVRFYRWMVMRDDINSTNDLRDEEHEAIVNQLRTWDKAGVLAERVAEAIA